MNYCVYNKDLDKFLFLVYEYDSNLGSYKAEWRDEFVYILAEPFGNGTETAWPMLEEDNNYSVFVYRRVNEMNISKNGMKDVRFIPLVDDIPDFERECTYIDLGKSTVRSTL